MYAQKTDLFSLNKSRFDFSLQLEQLSFSILPSALFIATSIWRGAVQLRKRRIVRDTKLLAVKAGAASVYLLLEVVLLALITNNFIKMTALFTAASVLKIVAAILMIILSTLDHSKSSRPSAIITVYLLASILLDGVQARTLALLASEPKDTAYSKIFIAATTCKVALLGLETVQKTPWIIWDEGVHSPEETSGIVSLGVYFWLNKLFRIGYSKFLLLEDLYALDHSMHASSLYKSFRDVERDEGVVKNGSLLKHVVRTLTCQIFLPVIPRLALICFTLCQPLLLERVTEYLSDTQQDANVGYGLIGACFFIYLGIAVSTALYWYLYNRARVMVRSILVSAIYDKATRQTANKAKNDAALTLMSTDIERIRVGFRGFHEIWACLLQTGIASYFLFARVGIFFMVPLGVVFICFLFLSGLLRITGTSQRKWMAAVELRVGSTATVIASLKSLKISAMIRTIAERLTMLRTQELEAGVAWRKMFMAAAILGFIPQLIAPALTFAVAGGSLSVSRIFTSLAFITLLTQPLTQVFKGVPQFLSGLACLGRIQSFLREQDHTDYRLPKLPPQESRENGLGTHAEWTLINANFGWVEGVFALRGISIEIFSHSFVLVVGSVGSGKSTLCKALLGEMPYATGCISVRSREAAVGVCEQTPFLFNASIRDNIVAGSACDDRRYAEVLHACALVEDLQRLPNRDHAVVGSDGVSLSGGQKQRVSLARALYLDSGILVLDDIFTGLDSKTERIVFQRVFSRSGLLRRRGATVILCTHSTHFLQEADQVIRLEDGVVVQPIEHAMTAQSANAGSPPRQERLGGELFASLSPISALRPVNDTEGTSFATTTRAPERTSDKGVYLHFCKSIGVTNSILALLFSVIWGFFTDFPTICKITACFEVEHSGIDSLGLTYWTDDFISTRHHHSYGYYAGTYAALNVCALISLLCLGITLWVFALQKAGTRLHRDAIQTLLKAPLSFFSTTDTGEIVNLFSQDLNLIDTELPNALLDTLFSVFQAVGQAGVMLASSVYLATAYPILALLLYFFGKVYLRTSKRLRILDLEAKSPLYTHFLDTIKGLTVLKSSRALPGQREKYMQLLDNSQRPAYLLLAIQEWLKVVLNMVVVVLAVAIVSLGVTLRSNSAFAGAALFSLITFGQNLAGVVLFYTRLENSLGAIARLKACSDTVSSKDQDNENVEPPQPWPNRGRVEIENVSAAYSAVNQTLALKSLCLTFEAGQTVAIVGRTGSGKSSLVALIMKLLDPMTGTIPLTLRIDGVDMRNIRRETVRNRVIAVSQDAVFLPKGSSYRANLDPGITSTPEDCATALSVVGLLDHVERMGGLEAECKPAELSTGNRHLFSIARALLRKRARELEGANGGLLILDEVSSSVDVDTERLINTIIKTKFGGYTVISVTHRLGMITEYDRVIVMDAGSVVEDGNPNDLATYPESRFAQLPVSASYVGNAS